MSQLDDSPSGLLLHFGDALDVRSDSMDEESLAYQIVNAVIVIAYAAADTAQAIEQQEEKNESA